MKQDWYCNEDESTLYRQRIVDFEDCYDVFAQDNDTRHTRHGSKYIWDHSAYGQHTGVKYVSVTHIDDISVALHSTAVIHQEPTITTGFLETLHSFENQGLWDNLVCDGDGECMHRGLISGSLCIVTDGSYQEHIITDLSSAGV